jgi:pilus assembly protein FimV
MHRAIGKPSWRSCRRFLGIVLMLVWNATGLAVGLGDIKVESGLNQAFLARVEVLLSAGEAPGDWTFELGDEKRYDLMGLRYPRDANRMGVTLLQLANGKTEILLEGQRPVTELFLDIVLTLNDGRSVQVRHYPVLIDFLRLAEPTQAVVGRPVVVRPGPVRPQAKPQQVQFRAGKGIYGPVQPGENLWRIAKKVRGDSGMNLNDLMAAIFQLNPDAFMGNDMGRLKVGMPLILPELGVAYLPTSTPGVRSPAPNDQINRPGLKQSGEDRSIDPMPESRSFPEPAARLELQGRPEAANLADSLDRWLESDNASIAANISEIRRDLSFAAAEIETYRNENGVLRTRIDDLELRASKLKTLLSLQTDTIATGTEASEFLLEEAAIDESEDPTAEETLADTPDPGWSRYALFALVLLVIFVLYAVVRNNRQERLRKEKTADLVNRLWAAGQSEPSTDDQ